MTVDICLVGPEFDRWDELLGLILHSFASMEGRIDPPSSARRLTADSLRAKAGEEACVIAMSDEKLVGCIFAAERDDHFYVGKLAVDPGSQSRGIARALMAAIEAHVVRAGKPSIELQTRIELTDNHAVFRKLGFIETARTAHAGYDRPTSITYRKTIAGPA